MYTGSQDLGRYVCVFKWNWNPWPLYLQDECSNRLAQDQCLKEGYHYRKVSNIRRTLVGNEIVDHSDVVGASYIRELTVSWNENKYRPLSIEQTCLFIQRPWAVLDLTQLYITVDHMETNPCMNSQNQILPYNNSLESVWSINYAIFRCIQTLPAWHDNLGGDAKEIIQHNILCLLPYMKEGMYTESGINKAISTETVIFYLYIPPMTSSWANQWT